MTSRQVAFFIVSFFFFDILNANQISSTNLTVEKVTKNSLAEIATTNKSAFILFYSER